MWGIDCLYKTRNQIPRVCYTEGIHIELRIENGQLYKKDTHPDWYKSHIDDYNPRICKLMFLRLRRL